MNTSPHPENGQESDIQRYWWLLIVGAVLAVLLMLALRTFVRDALALPVSYLLWIGGLVLETIPQFFFWTALLIIILVSALKSLGQKPRLPASKPPVTNRPSGSVAIWAERVELLLNGRYSRQRFGYYLGRLILDVLSHEERLGYKDIERRIEQEQLTLPPEVQEYLLARIRPGLPSRPTLIERLKQWLRLEQPSTSPLNRELENVIRYLEEQTHGLQNKS